ncbi:MAG: ABC transporter ATP-binding protein [Gemmatimonadales bacterium]|jgi:ABC-2 type transport system ATP-binding protein
MPSRPDRSARDPFPIRTRGLRKRYGRVTALEDLSLEVGEGEAFGFLGPNGAGKTTTIRLLLGLLRPSGGEAVVLGKKVSRAVAWRGEVGYLPGDMAFWPRLSGLETLDFLADLTGRPASARVELLKRLDLSAADLARPVRTYSDGMKQKLGIVQALQCAPRLALLDEPTKGLDPLMQQAFYEIVTDMRRRGATVFLSSHVIAEVERMCDRVAMLRAGRLVTVGSVVQLRQAERRRVSADFSADVDVTALAHFGDITAGTGRHVEMLVAQAQVAALVVRLGMLPLADVVIEHPTLEEAFLEHYR